MKALKYPYCRFVYFVYYSTLYIGLFHNKDVRSGNSISHSRAKTLRKWSPNAIKKCVWSETLDGWVRFHMTTTALKEIDNSGGIDRYIMRIDNKTVSESPYVTKWRHIIGTSLYHKKELSGYLVKKLGYDLEPPPNVDEMNKLFHSGDLTDHQIRALGYDKIPPRLTLINETDGSDETIPVLKNEKILQ